MGKRGDRGGGGGGGGGREAREREERVEGAGKGCLKSHQRPECFTDW